MVETKQNFLPREVPQSFKPKNLKKHYSSENNQIDLQPIFIFVLYHLF